MVLDAEHWSCGASEGAGCAGAYAAALDELGAFLLVRGALADHGVALAAGGVECGGGLVALGQAEWRGVPGTDESELDGSLVGLGVWVACVAGSAAASAAVGVAHVVPVGWGG